jgi:hypothetical protein
MDGNLIKHASHRIEQLYSLPLMSALLLAAIGFFWLFNFSSLPISNPELMKVSGGEGLLDVRLFYSAKEAYIALSHYSPSGRKYYLGFLAADFIFISIYSLGFAFMMTRTIRGVCGNRSPWLLLNVLPFFIEFFDCLENSCILGMLLIYPDSSLILGTLSGIATVSKWILTMSAVLSLVYGGVILLTRRLGFNHCRVER